MTEETLALLMSDLEDSTGGWDRNRRLMQELLVAYLDLVEKGLQPVPRVENFTGDGHLLTFPSVDAAAKAALRLREMWNKRRVTVGGDRVERTHRLKIGIHWDRVTRMEDGRLIGSPLNMCARVLGEATPDEILVSEPAFRNFDDRIRFGWGSSRSVKLRGLHSQDKAAPGTPLYPLLGLAIEVAGTSIPADGELRTRKIIEDLWTEATSLWGTPEADSDRELGLYRSILTISASDYGAHGNLGTLLARRGDIDGGERELREVVRLEPESAMGHYNLGVLLSGRGDEDAAEVEYREAIRLDPKMFEAHDNLGGVLGNRGDTAGAERAHREAIRLNPSFATGHYNLGITLDTRGDHASAEAEYLRAIQLNPAFAEAHDNLGVSLWRRGDAEGAEREHRESIRLNPKYANAHANLARILSRRGDLEGAVQESEMAVRLEPQEDRYRNSLQEVRNLRASSAGGPSAGPEGGGHAT